MFTVAIISIVATAIAQSGFINIQSTRSTGQRASAHLLAESLLAEAIAGETGVLQENGKKEIGKTLYEWKITKELKPFYDKKEQYEIELNEITVRIEWLSPYEQEIELKQCVWPVKKIVEQL